MAWSSQERRLMNLALAEARRGEGGASPNPLVGALVIRNGRVIAKGHHHTFGGPHAEVSALRRAGSAGRGATLLTTLEPCVHHGRTPPCVQAIIQAGVQKVISSMADPDARVRGRGFRWLRNAGIKVRVGLGRSDAAAMNWAYLLTRHKKRAAVVAKIAMSLDGKIAPRGGKKVWISGPESRKEGHAWRAWADGILVGVETVIRDNPKLTARGPQPGRELRTFHRLRPIVVDPMLRVPLNSRCLRKAGRPILVCSVGAPKSRRKKAELLGIEVLPIAGRGRILGFGRIAQDLLDLDVGRLLVEGGGRTLFLALRSGIVDRFVVFLAPKVLGAGAVPAMPGGWDFLRPYDLKQARSSGRDLVLEYAR